MTSNARPVPLQLSSQPFVIAVTGHRDLRTEATVAFVTEAFDVLLQRLKAEHPQGLIGLSGLAEGADTLFAEMVLQHQLPLEAIIAHAELLHDFAPGPARARYLHLRARSRAVHELPFAHRSVEAYIGLARRLVDSCDLLLAAWNGLPPIDEGGTGGVVTYARQCGKPITHIDTICHTIINLPPA